MDTFYSNNVDIMQDTKKVMVLNTSFETVAKFEYITTCIYV
jgi:hypothetical protein